jgi:hypothetical protein
VFDIVQTWGERWVIGARFLLKRGNLRYDDMER